MYSFKQSLAACAGLSLVIALVALVTPTKTQGQGGNPQPLNVNVINRAAAPVPVRDVDNPARQPYQKFLRSIEPSFTVPEGKRLVIEYFSGTTSMQAGCSAISAFIRTTVNTAGGEEILGHVFTPHLHAPALTFNGYSFGQQTRIYADPNTQVRVGVSTFPQEGCTADFLAGVSGYLVDAPQ